MHTAQAGPALPAETQRAESMWETVPFPTNMRNLLYLYSKGSPTLTTHARTHMWQLGLVGWCCLTDRGKLCAAWGRLKKKKKDNSCFCIYALLSTDFASRAVHHPGPSASQMRPFLPADTMVANVANSPKSEFHNSTIFKMLLYLLERVFIF